MDYEIVKKEQKRVDRKLAEGYGVGEFDRYRPFVTYYNGPGGGHKSSEPGLTTGRRHSLMSDLEADYFYILDFNPRVADIREQKPLADLFQAGRIAEELGIRYPVDRKGHLAVLTTDFMIFQKERNGDVSVKLRDIKTRKDLKSTRTLEKLEIARVYWSEKGYNDYKIITEDEINHDYAENVRRICFDSFLLDRLLPHNARQEECRNVIEQYKSGLLKSRESIRDYSLEFDRDNGLQPGTASRIFSRLLADRLIGIDMTVPMDLNRTTGEDCNDLSGQRL